LFSPDTVLSTTKGSGSGESRASGTTTTYGSSDSHTRGTADTKTTGVAVTEGIAVTQGRTKTESSGTGGSVAQTHGTSTTRGTAEAYVTRYELAPGPLWDLSEQIHCKSVAIAHAPVGQAWVRIGGKLPRKLVLPYLGEAYVLPERVARVRRLLLASTPYVAPADQVDAEYAAHRAALIEAATAPADEPENWREGE
jgi:hypothetical protein